MNIKELTQVTTAKVEDNGEILTRVETPLTIQWIADAENVEVFRFNKESALWTKRHRCMMVPCDLPFLEANYQKAIAT